MADEELNVISLGAGVQSTVMALMAARGELEPMPCAAIFADTKFEPQNVYKHLDFLKTQLPFPVHQVSEGNLKEDTLRGKNSTGQDFAVIPFYTAEGMGRRQCTQEYKLKPIRKKLRELLGLKKGQHAKGHSVRMWIGISTDEAMRMKPSRDSFVENTWPLIDQGMSRQDCLRWFEREYPGRRLTKSACVACPFHSYGDWREMKQNDTASFAEAVLFDRDIRFKGKKEEQFVHRSCQPLDEVDFRNLEDLGQMNMFNNECEGMCGV